jgi:hypothetical protein
MNPVSVYACAVQTNGYQYNIGSLVYKEKWRCVVFVDGNLTVSVPGDYKVLTSSFGDDLRRGTSTAQTPIPADSVTTLFPANKYARPCAFVANLYLGGIGSTPITFYGTANFNAEGQYQCYGASFYLWNSPKQIIQGAPFYLPVSY